MKMIVSQVLVVVALVGVVATAPFGNLATGAGAGLLVYWVVWWVARQRQWRRKPALGRESSEGAAWKG